MAAPGAFVVLSGLLPAQANAALAAYRAHGLVLVRRISLDGWATLVLRRPVPRQPRCYAWLLGTVIEFVATPSSA